MANLLHDVANNYNELLESNKGRSMSVTVTFDVN